MENFSFFVEYQNKEVLTLVEIKPWVREQLILYFDVLVNNNFLFSMSPFIHSSRKNIQCKVALKNADTEIDTNLIEVISSEVKKIAGF